MYLEKGMDLDIELGIHINVDSDKDMDMGDVDKDRYIVYTDRLEVDRRHVWNPRPD